MHRYLLAISKLREIYKNSRPYSATIQNQHRMVHDSTPVLQALKRFIIEATSSGPVPSPRIIAAVFLAKSNQLIKFYIYLFGNELQPYNHIISKRWEL